MAANGGRRQAAEQGARSRWARLAKMFDPAISEQPPMACRVCGCLVDRAYIEDHYAKHESEFPSLRQDGAAAGEPDGGN